MCVKLIALFVSLVLIVPALACIPETGVAQLHKSFFSELWNWIFHNKGGTSVGQDHILRGPPGLVGIPKTTVGKWILDYMTKLPQDKTMLIDASSGRKVNAHELRISSQKVAVILKEKYKVTKDDVIAVIGGNTISLNFVGFGTYFSGAIMAPIDPKFDEKQMGLMLEKYEPKIVFTEANLLKSVEPAVKSLKKKATIITVEASSGYDDLQKLMADVKDEQAEKYEAPDGDTNGIAAIIHSSGSSGYPKGIALRHYALIYQSSLFKTYHRDILWLQPSYFYWMSGVLIMIISGVFNGVPRVLVQSSDPKDIMSAIQTYKPAFMVVSPNILSKIVENQSVGDYDLKSMKYISMTGGPISTGLIKKANQVIKGSVLGNEYGITEISGVLAYGQQPMNVTSVGKPMPGFQIKVIDRQTNKTVGPNTDGEILVKGPTLFLKYVGEGGSKQTKASFDADGWYHTGDLGTYTSDDLLFVSGHITDTLTVNGEQISPEKIEEVINKLDGVDDVAVTGLKKGDQELPIALVVKSKGSKITEDQIKSAVKDKLSKNYQLQGGVKFVDEIPRTSTGKVDRKHLQNLIDES